MSKIPCLLCSKELQKRTDKNDKPYFVCDPCGMQIFIRGKQGIENLAELIVTLRKRDLPFREHAVVLHEIQALLTEMRGIKKEIKSKPNYRRKARTWLELGQNGNGSYKAWVIGMACPSRTFRS